MVELGGHSPLRTAIISSRGGLVLQKTNIMIKKYKKFFLVVDDNGAKYVKLESALIFSKEEGIKSLEDSHPNATEIKALTKKAASFLDLK